MHIKHNLDTLALRDPLLRREALLNILSSEGLAFTLQREEGTDGPDAVTNILLSPWLNEPSLLFCAHYDAAPGSCGANDNAAAVCILIELAKELRSRQIPARFAFFDAEERGFLGSKLYVSQISREPVTGACNLDVCGYGDTIAISGQGHENKPPFSSFKNRQLLEKHQAQFVKTLPKGDESSFSRTRIGALSLCIVPRWDIQYLKALATYGHGFLGKPPEYYMMIEQMEVTSTMHGASLDNTESVQEKAMEQVFSFLLDVMITPPPPKKRIPFPSLRK